MVLLKRLIFLYFILLIFEGALRKWILPGYATPLLIVRDPVLIAIYLVAFFRGVFPLHAWIAGIVALAGLSTLATLLIGHGHLTTMAFGIRANFLHVPLIFVIGRVLDASDVRRYGVIFMLLSVPMTLLVAVQFLSPPEARINVGIGGEGTASFDGVGDRMRSSGTFSFINGLVAFYSLAFAFWMGQIMDRRRSPLPWWLIAGVGAAILLAIPLSISRALMIGIGIIAAGASVCFLRIPGGARILSRFVLIGGFAALAASLLPVFDEAVDVMGQRVDEAARIEGDASDVFMNRILGDLIGPISAINFDEPFGVGIGAGTQVGAQLFVGERGFLGGEGEWWRLFWEMGVLLGGAFILYRIWLTVKLALLGWSCASRGNALPWLIFLAAGPLILNGQWGQSTALGFAVLGGGLAIAAIREPESESI